MNAASIYRDAWRSGFSPDPVMVVSEWADRFRRLASRAAAEPGPWRTRRTPYLREIMDCLSPTSPVERVVFMKGAQIGGTEAGNNWIGYIIHQAPGPTLAVQPTVEMAKRNSRQRIDPLIQETPALRGLVRDPRSRDSGNTVLSKEFPGGVLIMTGANSAVGLRSMPVRYLFLDEVDGFPIDADGEGDPVGLAMQRTATFARRKVLMVSTPTVAGVSRIEEAFHESDRRRYWVPCPDCGEHQVLRWANVRWPKAEPAKAEYCCEHCGALIPNHGKTAMLEAGEWRSEAEGDGRTAGFHLSSLYSPVGWFSWADAATAFEEARQNESRLKVWVNTVLGETWQERGDAPEWRRLYDRREDYPIGNVPASGLFLTAGADVQKDRIEVEIVAWGRDRESWSVDYRVLYGDPARPEVWADLVRVLDEPVRHASGAPMVVDRLAVDSGYATQEVYDFARRHPIRRVMAVKGVSRTQTVLGPASPVDVTADGRRIRRGARVWPVGVDVLKAQLYGWLRQDPPTEESGDPHPPGFCHFPKYSEEYFKQLTAEHLVRRQARTGRVTLEWAPVRDRNEALDCRIYAMAAALAAGIDRFDDERWNELARRTAFAKREGRPSLAPPPTPATIKSRWMEGGRR